jgi:hypothetical protein
VVKQLPMSSRKLIYTGTLIILSIIVLTACANTTNPNPPGNGQGGQGNTKFSTAAPPSTALICPNQQNNAGQGSFVGNNGTELVYQDNPLKLYGNTFYPATIGGASAWYKPEFTQYIDHILEFDLQAGQNLVRPTDFWDDQYHDQRQVDVNIWKNMDYLVCAAKQRGIFVEMDVSAFGHFLISQGSDPYDAGNWLAFLDAVGKHYTNQTAIAFYSILGEPTAPKDVAAMNRLVGFYRAVTDELSRADGEHHLIMAGGFNHMEDETAQTPWWQQIYALPHNTIIGFKTYSQSDLELIPTIAAFAKGIGKPFVDEEFGLPQGMGDARSTGKVYNSLQEGRAQFYEQVYSIGETGGVAAFVFWDMGCQLGNGSYQVSPLTPAVWSVIQKHAPNKPAAPGSEKPLC